MERDLEDHWQRVEAACERVDPVTRDIINRVYWFGVTTGVQVFCKAIEGEYQ